MRILSFTAIITLLIFSAPAWAENGSNHFNKLLYMYRLYYLPFSIDFREGRTKNDILPFRGLTAEGSELLSADELTALDHQWEEVKGGWKKRSLLLNTSVTVGEKVQVAPRMFSHKITLSRGALDTLSIPDRIQINDLMRGKSTAVQADFKQLRFLKSFIEEKDEHRLNFFIFSASWCSSCREYRSLLESYLKSNPHNDVVLHSVVIDDPNQKIFESKILTELFPHPERYSHDSIPRFIAVETLRGKPVVYEEGDALATFYERYLKPLRGFLNSKSLLFRGQRSIASDLPSSVSGSLRSGSIR